MKKRHLILGGSSFVGLHLYELLGPEGAIITYNTRPVLDGIQFDSTTAELTEIITNPESIDQAILLLGDTNPDSCIADRNRSHLVNVEGIKRVLDQLEKWNIRPIFTSSEFVFDGATGDYVESDQPNPILLYGKQKLEIEKYLFDTFDDFVILRLAKIYGDNPDDGTLFDDLIKNILTKSSMRVAADQKFSPVYVGDVCDAIVAALDKNLHGTYHVAGPQRLTRLECLETAIASLEYYRPVRLEIEACSIYDFDLPEKRPQDVSMNPAKLVADAHMTLRTAAESCQVITQRMFADQ